MSDYVLLYRGGLDMRTASPDQIQKAMAKWQVWIDRLVAEGKYRGGQRLNGVGSVIRGEGKLVQEGPYAEGKEILGGFSIVKARDLAEAIEIARQGPIFDYGGLTEVREIVAS